MRVTINRNCNVHITFDNGVTVSILIGGGSYSENHDDWDLLGHEQERKQVASGTAEVAMWIDGEGEFITNKFKGEDDVLGWQDTTEILKALNWAASYENDQTP